MPHAPRRVAAIVTEYRKWSHADVILRNLLDGYPRRQDGPDLRTRVAVHRSGAQERHEPRPGEEARLQDLRHHRGGLTLGGKTLAVDGVLSIGEHGNYPDNEKGQKLYPRRRFFEEICKVFEKTEKSVPVFNDKHLAATWDDAKWMYDRARKLMVPFMAGSSIPVTWRKPDLDAAEGVRTDRGGADRLRPVRGYGFHALEGLQCMVERRKGGETGVKAVTCHDRQGDVGGARQARRGRSRCSRPRSSSCRPTPRATSASYPRRRRTRALRDRVPRRLRAFVVMPNGWIHEGDGGGVHLRRPAQGRGRSRTRASFYLQQPDPFAHFADLTKAIDSLMQTGHAPYPVERTLLTTGILDAAMTSRHEKGKRIETPHLEIKYTPTDWVRRRLEIPKAQKK